MKKPPAALAGGGLGDALVWIEGQAPFPACALCMGIRRPGRTAAGPMGGNNAGMAMERCI
ncbi:MAG TPA: hypothetical protein VND90_12665 [Terracidiphilus sp.]|nr:hypothetical protein [Terracidiphilus sp.]